MIPTPYLKFYVSGHIKGLILCPLGSWQKPGEIFKQERARVTFVFTKALSRVHMEVSEQEGELSGQTEESMQDWRVEGTVA